MINIGNYKKAEYYLYNYKNMQAEIKNILIEIEDIENSYRGIGAIGYDERSTPTNKISSIVEQEIEQKENRIEYLNQLIIKKENMIKRVDNALEVLSDRDKLIIEEYYFKKNQLKYISSIVNLEPNYLSNYKSDLINKLTNLMFITD